MLHRSGKLESHLSHLRNACSGMGSSHSSSMWQRFMHIKRTSSTTGATNPKGSKSEFTVESRPRRVFGLNGKAIENRNVSDCTFHGTPNICSCSLQSNACTCNDFVSSFSGMLANRSSLFDNHFSQPEASIVDLPFRITTCRFLLAIVFRT